MKISIFEDIFGSPPQTEELSWEDLENLFEAHSIISPRKDDGTEEDKTDAFLEAKMSASVFSPAEFNGQGITKEHVTRVHFFVLDLDDVTAEDYEKVIEIANDYQYIIYTTYKHAQAYAKNGSWRSRILIPLSKPVIASSWEKFWKRANALFLNKCDIKCKDASRRYFAPSAPTEDGAIIKRNKGKELDVDVILSQPEPQKITEGREITRVEIQEMARKMTIRKSEFHKEMGRVILKGLKGEPMAPAGSRDDTYYKMTGILAEEYPNSDPTDIAAHFNESLTAARKDGSNKSNMKDLVAKITRHQTDAREVIAQKQADEANEQTMLIQDAFSPEDRSHPYTEEELNRFADEAHVSREKFKSRWVLYGKNSHYVFKNGTYIVPCGKEDLLGRAKIDLAPACTADVTRWKIMGKGDLKLKTANEFLEDYGTNIFKTMASLSAQKSYYDPKTRTLHEATAPLRDLIPKRDEQIEKWLSLLGSKDENRLLDWIAAVTLLDRPCAALYLSGEHSAGKNLLAEGLTRLWHTGDPTPLEHATGSQFNDALARCPLVLVNEDLPEQFKRPGGLGMLKAFISSYKRKLDRKFADTAELEGSIRLMMVANNDDLLKTNDISSTQDADAAIMRICHIRVGKPPAEYLEQLGGLETTTSWVAGDKIACHALWLRQNRQIDTKNRFILDSVQTDFHRNLMIGTGIADAVSHWLVSYLQNPQLMDLNRTGLILIKKGELLVSAKVLTDHWDIYKTNTYPPKANQVSKGLSRICKEGRVKVRLSGRQIQYRVVDKANLIAWGRINSFITAEEIEEALAKDTEYEDATFSNINTTQIGIAE